MVFEIPAAQIQYFEFTMPGKKKMRYKIPLAEYLPMSIRQTLGKAVAIASRIQATEARGRTYEPNLEEVQMLGQAQTLLLEKYAPGLADQLTEAQLKALMEAYGEASQVTLGESLPSSR